MRNPKVVDPFLRGQAVVLEYRAQDLSVHWVHHHHVPHSDEIHQRVAAMGQMGCQKLGEGIGIIRGC